MLASLWVASLLLTSPSGSQLVRKFECHRCHDGLNQRRVKRERHCVRCHQDILEDRYDAAPSDVVKKWRGNLHSLNAVPSLSTAKTLRAEWIAEFLQEPHDLRPRLGGQMPRLQISKLEAERIGRYLGSATKASPVPNAEAVTRGRALYGSLSCGACHEFGGSRVAWKAETRSVESRTPSQFLAPDLRFTRSRMNHGRIVRKLKETKATGQMPSFSLSAADASDLAAFIEQAPLEKIRPLAPVQRLPVLTRPVPFSEVKATVFKKTCRHCHANPERAFGDGGPGNTGGFGYAGAGLSLASYREIQTGSRGPDGRRRSIFRRLPDGTPMLVAHLMARHDEVRGRPGRLVGMPLGLPPLDLESIQLIESWIEQGRPR